MVGPSHDLGLLVDLLISWSCFLFFSGTNHGPSTLTSPHSYPFLHILLSKRILLSPILIHFFVCVCVKSVSLPYSWRIPTIFLPYLGIIVWSTLKLIFPASCLFDVF